MDNLTSQLEKIDKRINNTYRIKDTVIPAIYFIVIPCTFCIFAFCVLFKAYSNNLTPYDLGAYAGYYLLFLMAMLIFFFVLITVCISHSDNLLSQKQKLTGGLIPVKDENGEITLITPEEKIARYKKQKEQEEYQKYLALKEKFENSAKEGEYSNG